MRLFLNMDCMEGMKEYPDDCFDLAIVDPPYGGAGVDTTIHGAEDGRFGNKGSWFEKYREIKASRTGGGWASRLDPDRKINKWDVAPDKEYFKELFRVSKNQIIWGGELLRLTTDKMLSCMAKTDYIRKLHNGDGRIRMDEF